MANNETTKVFIEKKFNKYVKFISNYTADGQAALIQKLSFTKKYDKSECCALGGIIVSIIMLLASWGLASWVLEYRLINFLIKCLVGLIACWWMAGAFTYPLKVVFVDMPGGGNIKSPTRSIILFFINYIEIIMHFSTLYLLSGSIGHSGCVNGITCPLDAIYFSVVTITTLGFGDMQPISYSGKVLALGEVMVGLVFIVTVLARFVAEAKSKRN